MGKYSKMASQYQFTVVNISEGDEIGFTAVIPKFPKMYICADSVEELVEVIHIFIEEEIERLKKEGSPIPKPDRPVCHCSGRFVLRTKPELHERLIHLAYAEATSLNQYLNRLIEKKIGPSAKTIHRVKNR